MYLCVPVEWDCCGSASLRPVAQPLFRFPQTFDIGISVEQPDDHCPRSDPIGKLCDETREECVPDIHFIENNTWDHANESCDKEGVFRQRCEFFIYTLDNARVQNSGLKIHDFSKKVQKGPETCFIQISGPIVCYY